MKRLAFIAACIVLLLQACPANAQIRGGIISGVNFSTMNIKGDRDVSGESVLGIGSVFEVDFPGNLSLVLQPMYLRKYVTAEQYYDSPPIAVKMAFFEIPVLLKYSFGQTIRPYVLAGPSIGFLLTSTMETEYFGITFDVDTRDITENPNFGFVFGGGVSATVRRATLFLEMKYSMDFVDLMNGGVVTLKAGRLRLPGHIAEEEEAKSRGLQLMTGVTFSLWR